MAVFLFISLLLLNNHYHSLTIKVKRIRDNYALCNS